MSDDERTSAPSPRIIERWFPCAEVSAASSSGWGSSNSETLIMSWFAKRPLAQSRAAVLCSLLPWPKEESEQQRVQAILKEALGICQDPGWYACTKKDCDTPDCSRKAHMQQASRKHAFGIVDCAKLDPSGGYDAARTDVLRLLKAAYPDRPAEMLDPFSGRGLIPLEAARYGQKAHAIDYSPVATLASRLLVDWPFRDWSNEPQIPFVPPGGHQRLPSAGADRLIQDIITVHSEVSRRVAQRMNEFFPDEPDGTKAWGYVWAQVITCDGCGKDFPLYSSSALQQPNPKSGHPGTSFSFIEHESEWSIAIAEGINSELPTMRPRAGKRGKLAWCPRTSCGHGHELPEHKRLVSREYSRLNLLVVAADNARGIFRIPNQSDISAAERAAHRLSQLKVGELPARPNEKLILGGDRIGATQYGAKNFGDLSVDRQNLHHFEIARAIDEVAEEMQGAGCSDEYAMALAGYCGATLARKLKYSTRGAWIRSRSGGQIEVAGIFVNESALGFNYDSFETGIGQGPGTWDSVSGIPSALRVISRTSGLPATVSRGSATSIPAKTALFDAVVTDPPYEMMITYSDASDLYYVWLRRSLMRINPDYAITSDPNGTQEKSDEIIVHRNYTSIQGEHRTPAFYRQRIAEAFRECRRVVSPTGVVTIVFGHGDPEAWRQLLDAVSEAGLVLTGAWPANTEKGGQAGSANIQTTLTLACRPAPANRPQGRAAEVDAEMRKVIAERVHNVWNPAGLSYVDQKMAASGPALEVVGRYSAVLDKRGEPVDLNRYLPLARQAVTEAHNLSFDSLPLDTFDQKTRFALEWVRSHGRQVQAASEARWNRLASDLEESDTEGVLKDVDKGVRLAFASEAKVEPGEGLSTFEVALVAAHAWKNGTLADAATVIRDSKVEGSDPHFWACIRALSQNLPETDRDGAVWTSMVRNREALASGVANAEAAAAAVVRREEQQATEREQSPVLFEDPNSLFGQEG